MCVTLHFLVVFDFILYCIRCRLQSVGPWTIVSLYREKKGEENQFFLSPFYVKASIMHWISIAIWLTSQSWFARVGGSIFSWCCIKPSGVVEPWWTSLKFKRELKETRAAAQKKNKRKSLIRLNVSMDIMSTHANRFNENRGARGKGEIGYKKVIVFICFLSIRIFFWVVCHCRYS